MAMAVTLFIMAGMPWTRAESAELADAEKIAWRYMTSVLRGDVEMSFSLMDQRVLDQRKADIEKAYEFSKKQGKADEFKARFKNLDDLDSALKLPPKQFFVLMVKKDRENAPAEHLKAMRQTIVNVIGSRRIDNETARVDLKITPPESISETPQEDGLILTLYQGQWKVVKNAK
jgi:hypothetical protein